MEVFARWHLVSIASHPFPTIGTPARFDRHRSNASQDLLLNKETVMRKLVLELVCVSLTLPVFAKTEGYTVKYDGGSISDLKAGNELKLFIDGGQIRLMKGKSEVAPISPSSVTEISYGQDVHRRSRAIEGSARVFLGG
jgi:hypothetical protein